MANNNTQREPNRPVHVVRYGSIKAAIWRNVIDNGNASRPMYNVTVTRSYRDGEQQWHDSTSFGYDDLLVVAKAVGDCHTWIAAQMVRDSQERQREEREPSQEQEQEREEQQRPQRPQQRRERQQPARV